MTIAPETTDWRAARRADRAAEREQDRIDAEFRARQDREERIFRADRETARRTERAEQRRTEKIQRRRDRAAARGQRMARWRKRAIAVRDHGDVAATLVVMSCGMVPALVAQYRALISLGMGLVLGCLLPLMLELGAWAATAGEAKALKEGRRVWPYRLGVWCFAVLAAGVNAWHGTRDYGTGGGIILAASSLAPVALWHMVMAGRHSARARKTKAQLAAERAERKATRERVQHAKARRKHHVQVAALADRLISAAPFGALDPEEAWRQAWEAIHGAAAPGMTPELYAAAATARHRLAAAFEMDPGESEQIRTALLEGLYGPDKTPRIRFGKVLSLRGRTEKIAQVASQMPPSKKRQKKAPSKPPLRRKGDTPKYHPIARAAARETALASASEH